MQIEFDPHVNDIIALATQQFQQSPAIQRQLARVRSISALVITVLICISGMLPALFFPSVRHWEFLPLPLIAALVAGLSFYLPAKPEQQIDQNVRKHFFAAESADLRSPKKLTVTSTGLQLSSTKSETTFAWATLDAPIVTDDYVFLMD